MCLAIPLCTYFISIDPLHVCFGNPGDKSKHTYLKLTSEAALAHYRQLSIFLPKDPAKLALKLLSLFFTDHQLSVSNCTKAEGREILDQKILEGIMCKFASCLIAWTSFCYIYRDSIFPPVQVNFKYPVAQPEELARWQGIIKCLNNKCRSARKKLKVQQDTTDALL